MTVSVVIVRQQGAGNAREALSILVHNTGMASVTLVHCQITARALNRMAPVTYSNDIIGDNEIISLPPVMEQEFEIPATTLARFVSEQKSSRLRIRATFIDTNGNGYDSESFEYSDVSQPH